MIKRTNRMALAAMRNTALVWSSAYDDRGVRMYDLQGKRFVTVNHFHHHAIQKMQHKWQMMLVAVGVEPCGGKYFKTELHALNEPRFHTATVEYFNAEHKRMIDSINPKHETQAAWIATISNFELSDDLIMEIIEL